MLFDSLYKVCMLPPKTSVGSCVIDTKWTVNEVICEKWYYPILCVCIQPVRSPVRAVVWDKPEFYQTSWKPEWNVPKAETCYLGMEGNRHGKWEAVCHVYFYDVNRVSGVNGIVCMHTTVPSPKSAATSPSGAGNITLGGMYEKMVWK